MTALSLRIPEELEARLDKEARRAGVPRSAIARTALGALADQGVQFDVIYLDPPYDSDVYEPLLAVLGEGPLLAQGGVVVAEHFHKRALPETISALTRTREKRVGDHCLSFYRRASEAGRTVGADEEARGAEGAVASSARVAYIRRPLTVGGGAAPPVPRSLRR